MLLSLAIGDAYGAAFEYSPESMITQHNTGQYYSKHPRHKIAPGHYTDDTQMTLAIAEALVSGERWTPLNLASRFVEVFKRDPRVGYAGGFYKFLCEIKSGREFLEKIKPTSDKSGAAMRTTPIGLCETLGEVEDKTRIQAAITHNTPDGIDAALAASYMIFYFHKAHGLAKDLPAWLSSELDPRWAVPWEGKVKSKGWMSVRAAITAVSRNNSMTSLLIDCCNFRGDVDTVATIALAAASLCEDYEQDLDEVLLHGLENHTGYGRDYLIKLDSQLMERYDG